MKAKASWNDIAGILLMAAGILMLGVSVFLCFSNDIWYDELFTMGLAGQPLRELIEITAKDVHPPFYYMIVKLFLEIGNVLNSSADQVVIAKLVSVLPFFLCFIYGLTRIRKNFGIFSAGLYVFSLLAMPQMGDYTVEVRMYGYALFFITAAMIHAYELTGSLKENRRAFHWVALTFYSIGACYTHYFACVAACMIYGYLFVGACVSHQVRGRLKPFLASGLMCTVSFLPWLITVVASQVGAVKENYWIMPLSVRTLGGCVKFLFRPALGNEFLGDGVAVFLFLFYVTIFVLYLCWCIRQGNEKDRRKLCFCAGCIGVLAGIVAFGFIASLLVRPIFVYRYMLPALGLFWLAFSIMFSEVWHGLFSRIRMGKILCVALLLAVFVTGVRNYRSFYGEEMWKRVQMEKTREFIAQIGQEDLLLFNFGQVQGVISYYLDNDSWLWYEKPEDLICRMYSQNHSLVEGEFEDKAGMEKIRELVESGRRVWFLGSGEAREEIIQKWKEEGIQAELVSEALLERYWFNIYQMTLSDQ